MLLVVHICYLKLEKCLQNLNVALPNISTVLFNQLLYKMK